LKINILIVTPFLPYPLNSGGNIAQYEMIDGIRDEYNVTLVFPLNRSQKAHFFELQTKWSNVTFYPFFYNLKSKFKGLFTRRLPVKYSHFLDRFYGKGRTECEEDDSIIRSSTLFRSSSEHVNPEFIVHVKKVISQNKVDQVQVEFFELISLVSYLPQTLRKIFIVHELRYIREQRELALLGMQSAYHQFLLTKNKGFELSFLDQYDTIVPVTIDDFQALNKEFTREKLFLSPLTIKQRKTKYTKFYFENSLIFLGGDDHVPNRHGLNWFITKCWKDLKNKYPALQLRVIGKWSDANKELYNAYPNITFAGFVEDLGKVIQNGIFIVPIYIGSGMRMKIIDAVAYGTPIVTTTIGVEGFTLKNERDCLVANNPDDFVQQIKRVMNDEALANTLIKNATQTLSDEHSYDKSISRRRQLYSSVSTQKIF
jgi:glycosyltransferase involved in cell wall biosynthesis